ncbi:MAG: Ldh family oxidoreductase [Gaiellaceae bacterium]
MTADEGRARLRALGFAPAAAQALWEHFDDAERRGKPSHGHGRVAWLETQAVDPAAAPVEREESDSFWRWDAAGAVGYLVVEAAVERCIARPPERVRAVVLERCFPTGMLGRYARRLAAAGLVGILTATSPRRLGPPGGPKLAGTNPLAIGVPSSDGRPLVSDVSMGAVTWGDVIGGRATEDELVPFGGAQWHKAFALALGLQLVVDALVSVEGHGAVLLVARPESDPVPALRGLAGDARLPGDSPAK